MKKILLVVVALILCFSPVSAEKTYAAEDKDIDDVVEETLNNIDLSGYEELLRLLQEYNDYSFTKSARQIVEDIIYGNAEPTFSYFLKAFGNLVGIELTKIVPQFVVMGVIALLYGVLNHLNSGFTKAGTQKIVYIACYSLIVTAIVYMFVDTIKYTTEMFGFLQKFNDICFPVLLTMISAIGASATVAVYQPFVLIFSNLLSTIVTTVIMPLFYIMFVFGIVGNLSDNIKLDKFSSVAKSLAEWILGIVFGTFATLLTAQGITGASIDNLAVRGAKYALSSYVPIVGGYLKDGFDIVLAGCVVIKNALGLCSLLILLCGILLPIIKISVLSFGLKITAAIVEPLSNNKFSAALTTAGDSLKILIIAILCMGLSLIIAVMLIIYTCNPAGL